MSRARRAAGVALAALLFAPFLVGLASAGPSVAGPEPSQLVGVPSGVSIPTSGSSGPAVAPSLASCSTPASNGHWGSGGFFQSVKVQFFVPGSPGLSGSNFNVTPCTNTIPTYVNGFWMNLSTDVPLQSAIVTVWGLQWALPTQQYPTPIPGFSPGAPYDVNTPTNISMYLNPPSYQSASFYFNDYKNFWPGSQVFFNVTVTAQNATPGILASSSDKSHTAIFPNGTNDLADWQFNVQSPWTSNNFSQDIEVSTTPDVFGNPAYEPNPKQPLTITLHAINLGGGTTLTIPQAQLNLQEYVGPGQASSYQAPFGPANHSVETLIDSNTQLPRTIGPLTPGAKIVFNITAWVPWEGGAIDRIYSPYYEFNWSKNGGWWQPHNALEANLNLTTVPGGLNVSPTPTLPTMTPVNVSIHEEKPNVTIGSAAVQFDYRDPYGTSSGTINMTAINYNTSYAVLPGLPRNASVTFSVLAKDINGNTVASSNYSYIENGPLEAPPAAGTGFLFFEAVDLSTGNLFPHLPFVLSNSTWTEKSKGTALGFGGIFPPAGPGYLPLSYGNYTLTVSAFGASESANIHLGDAVSSPVVFYFTSEPLPSLGTVTATTAPIAGALGIIAAAIAVVPIRDWFKERRKKAEAEQKRISL